MSQTIARCLPSGPTLTRMDNSTSAHSANDHEAYALEAIERSEHTTELSDRLELLTRAQAWAMLRIGDLLACLVEALAARRAGQ